MPEGREIIVDSVSASLRPLPLPASCVFLTVDDYCGLETKTVLMVVVVVVVVVVAVVVVVVNMHRQPS